MYLVIAKEWSNKKQMHVTLVVGSFDNFSEAMDFKKTYSMKYYVQTKIIDTKNL